MAPRKNKNKINDEAHCAAAANKRRRIELMNTTTGVPFTNPISQFLSLDLLHQQRNLPPQTTVIHTDLNLSPPSATHQDEEAAVDEDHFNSLIPPQNFLIGYHINQMRLSVEEFWRRNFGEEVKKRQEIEAKLKQKEELADRLRQLYNFYEERTFRLEEMLQRRVAEGCSTPAAAVREEEVESNFVDPRSASKTDMACRNCRSRRATMLWLPCRHLCVCLVCERRVKICPICGAKKTESFMISLPLP
ncbi:unnamed protein product [Lactuca virosa]|uniref:RING-type domain-containing protein n=1 Tax=Lactuca virosa TaxID=75947 RepID=A0AAU9NLV1_9ASTR|nr:unnamed protein product [Lactuca virosa]